MFDSTGETDSSSKQKRPDADLAWRHIRDKGTNQDIEYWLVDVDGSPGHVKPNPAEHFRNASDEHKAGIATVLSRNGLTLIS